MSAPLWVRISHPRAPARQSAARLQAQPVRVSCLQDDATVSGITNAA